MHKKQMKYLVLLTNCFFGTVNRDLLGLAILVRQRENRLQAILSAFQAAFGVSGRNGTLIKGCCPTRVFYTGPRPQEALFLQGLLNGYAYSISTFAVTCAIGSFYAYA